MDSGQFTALSSISSMRSPHCIVTVRPWLDAGNVGKHVLTRMARIFKAKALARLTMPGKYYDFTRYRPIAKELNGKTTIELPNTVIYAGTSPDQSLPDFLLMYILEPHSYGEQFLDAICDYIMKAQVRRYVLVGGEYDAVPHTRPLVVTGESGNWQPDPIFVHSHMRRGRKTGPTSIMNLLPSRLMERAKIETLSLTVHLPSYLKIQNDYMGSARLLTAISSLYGLPERFPEHDKAERLAKRITQAIEKNDQVKNIVRNYAKRYEDGYRSSKIQPLQLSPEIEKFISEVAQREEDEGEKGL